MNTAISPMYRWNEINWRKLERRVFKLQKRIFQASNRGNVKLVRRLQKLLISSRSARLLAVRRVTQDNQGRKTAGVDGVKSLTPKQRLILVDKIKLGTKAKPTRRVWIPKPGTSEERPLGIPTMEDRALQAVVKMVLEPEWESKFEPNSYGFRPGRSCHDAIEAIFSSISKKSKYVLDADISKCFDRINHNKLLSKLNTFPTLRKQIRAWLKAGVMDGKKLFPTNEGTPQGGVLSPLLANIALHGLEELIMGLAPKFDMKRPNGNQLPVRDKLKSICCVRYADDFVILHEDLKVINQCKKEVEEWLSDIGLELKPSKTRIAHCLSDLDGEKAGFNFLGFNIRQFSVGKYSSGKSSNGKLLGYKTIIRPSIESQKRHYKKLKEEINKRRGLSQSRLINSLNPIVRGWCNYFCTVNSKEVFGKIYSLVFLKLFKWGSHRHPNKGKKWIRHKYFKSINNNNWLFATLEGNNLIKLVRHDSIEIKRHVKVKGNSSPYDGDWVYWSSRMGKHPEVSTKVGNLLKTQKGKCAHCKNYFKDGDSLEVDHIIPKSKGGKDKYENWQLLHRHCHDTKTVNDGSSGTKSNCNSVEPKPPVKPESWFWQDDMLVMTH
ncbi:group II intron reverse transcriptase/maturase [Chamaesiphon minutus]|uniref:Retron-type reverse transcriptase n=1 Tax=Chamaesiphon minutus (strain ATCC 27169 / PCC 6605) TaxID=1173020 RepID=K9UEN1_CHAP6|nr:group II intron reverse transcriptase/maturase [Chamaesiphon minutus]AFY92876.1 Retron-type reverse transcriptase [Chamaesiphon minutus PCC 6605]